MYDHWYCFGACQKRYTVDEVENQLGLRPNIKEKRIENVEQTIKYINGLERKTIRGVPNIPYDNDFFYILGYLAPYYLKSRHERRDDEPKYIGPTGVSRPIFKPLQNDGNPLIVVEGEMNVLSIGYSNPNYNVISCGGVNGFQKHLDFYRKYDKIVLIADEDLAGLEATLLTRLDLLEMGKEVSIKLMKDDANTILIRDGKETLAKFIQETVNG